MKPEIRLTDQERQGLDRIKEKLAAQGIRLDDAKFILALLRAAAQLPEEDLVKLIKETLESGSADRNPGNK